MPVVAVAHRGTVVVSVFMDPFTDEVYTAMKGTGCVLLQRPTSRFDDDDQRPNHPHRMRSWGWKVLRDKKVYRPSFQGHSNLDATKYERFARWGVLPSAYHGSSLMVDD